MASTIGGGQAAVNDRTSGKSGGGARPDRVTMLRHADKKLQQAEMLLNVSR
ncbi:MAG: hypothetical protein HYS64_07485, partial [Rhodospirillales bacterium]|nr:hypothetical protein [Rhodospirillales bacterium]